MKVIKESRCEMGAVAAFTLCVPVYCLNGNTLGDRGRFAWIAVLLIALFADVTQAWVKIR